VEPFYTGPPDRATPAIFVLKGTGAFLITGPHPVEALKDTILDLGEPKAARR